MGGHVFHFVHYAPGIVRLKREDADAFVRRYRFIENRSIRVARLAVPEERERRVGALLTERWMAQERRLGNLQALGDERRLLEAVRAGRRGEAREPIALAGPGYFLASDDEPPRGSRGTDPSLVRLRASVAATRGSGFLGAQIDAARDAVASLPPPPAHALRATSAAGEQAVPRRRRGFATRYGDLVVRLRALEILRDAPALRPEAARATRLTLGDEERGAVRTLRDTLARRALGLLDSGRPDVGLVLAATLARLAVLDRTLRTNQWIVLDTFPDDAVVLDPDHVARHHASIVAAVRSNSRELARARRELVAVTRPGHLPEGELATLERCANRLLEARDAAVAPRPYRLAGGSFVPARAMRHVRPVLPWSDAALSRAVAAVRTAEDRERGAIESRYGYDLVRRNCVTELVRALDDAGVAPASNAPLDFIPVVTSTRLARRFPVGETIDLPSRRSADVASLWAREPALLVAVRESNTLTATAYRRNPDDSLFLFFTDGPVAARPLLGALNLGVGLGATVAGLATLPVDGGHLSWVGAQGALFSLPELVFVNIRKGSYDHLPDDGLPDASVTR